MSVQDRNSAIDSTCSRFNIVESTDLNFESFVRMILEIGPLSRDTIPVNSSIVSGSLRYNRTLIS